MNTEHTSEPSKINLCFDNRFTRELPADPETDNYRRQVEHACYSRVQPTGYWPTPGKSPRTSA